MLPEVKDLKEVKRKADEYHEVFDEKDYSKRTQKAQDATDRFYDLITEFYERGWGQSFHFAPRQKGENFHDSILRHEHFLSDHLGLTEKDRVLDVGCGVMGPARAIARYSGAHITGITINEHQIGRCKTLNKENGLDHLLDVVQGDFMDLPFEDESFDKIYAIEALCHAPSLEDVYQQIYSKLKPGGKACFYQWCMTDKYDPNNPEHVKAKDMIEYGNSIAHIRTMKEMNEALKKSSFTDIKTQDLAVAGRGNDIPWYATLQSGWSLSQIRHTKASRTLMSFILRILESVGAVKKGVCKTQKILLVAADGLVAGGRLGIFTPLYFIEVRKPLND